MSLFLYLGQASLMLAVLYGAYWLLLRRETFYRLNRIILLFIIAASLLLPLLPAPGIFTFPKDTDSERIAWAGQQLPFLDPGTPSTTSGKEPAALFENGNPPTDTSRYTAGLKLLYAGVAVAFLLRLLFQLALALRFIRQASLERIPEGWLAVSAKASAPFTFWNVIFLPDRFKDDPLRKHILQHERVHARHLHSADLLLSEVFCALLWFHPLAWMLNRSIRLQLEYLVDEAVLRSGTDPKEYQYSLLSLASGKNGLRLANQFNHSLIKTRIVMMNAKKSPELAKWKYFALLSLGLLLAVCINDAAAQTVSPSPKVETTENKVSVGVTESSASATVSEGVGIGKASSKGRTAVTVNPGSVGIGQGEAPALNGESVFVVIAAEFPEDRIPQLKADLKEQGVLIDFDELKYNSEGLITSVKVSVRTADGRMHGNGFSENDGQPIEDPIVFYLSREDGRNSFGIFSGKPNSKLPPKVQSVLRDMKNGYFVGNIITE